MKWISCAVCGTARKVYRYGKFCSNACTQKAKRLREWEKRVKDIFQSKRAEYYA